MSYVAQGQENGVRPKKSMGCFRCGRQGHLKCDCRTHRQSRGEAHNRDFFTETFRKTKNSQYFGGCVDW